MTAAILKTPGLTVHWQHYGSFYYPTIRHEPSGKILRAWDRDRLTTGKRAFCAKADAALSAFDWTGTEEEISADRPDERRAAALAIPY